MEAHDRTNVFGAPLFDAKAEEGGEAPMTSFAVHHHHHHQHHQQQQHHQTDGSLSDFGDDDEQDEAKKTVLDEKAIDRKKKTRGRVKIRMEFIENKLRRYTTFSKRKTGIMKKAYELSTLTGTQVMLLVASETGHVYTFATPKLQPMITSESGKALIQTCLNSPDPLLQAAQSARSRMSSTGYEETELAYPVEDERKHSDLLNAAGIFPGSSGMNGACQSPLDQMSPSSAGSLQQLGMPPLHGMSNYLPSSPSAQPKVASPGLSSYSQGMYSSSANVYPSHNPAVSQHATMGRETTSPQLIHPPKPHYHPQSPTLSPAGLSPLPQSTLASAHTQSSAVHYGNNSGLQHGMSVYNHQLLPSLSSQDISATTPSPHSPLPQTNFALAGEHGVQAPPQQQHQPVQRMSASEFYSTAASMVPSIMQRPHGSSAVMLDNGAYRDLPGPGQPLLPSSLNHRIPIAH